MGEREGRERDRACTRVLKFARKSLRVNTMARVVLELWDVLECIWKLLQPGACPCFMF